jgi:hypothetical protein
MKPILLRWWQRFKAYWRLDLYLICEMSRGLPADRDYHDYPDSLVAGPLHMYEHTCRRCGKHFTI